MLHLRLLLCDSFPLHHEHPLNFPPSFRLRYAPGARGESSKGIISRVSISLSCRCVPANNNGIIPDTGTIGYSTDMLGLVYERVLVIPSDFTGTVPAILGTIQPLE